MSNPAQEKAASARADVDSAAGKLSAAIGAMGKAVVEFEAQSGPLASRARRRLGLARAAAAATRLPQTLPAALALFNADAGPKARWIKFATSWGAAIALSGAFGIDKYLHAANIWWALALHAALAAQLAAKKSWRLSAGLRQALDELAKEGAFCVSDGASLGSAALARPGAGDVPLRARGLPAQAYPFEAAFAHPSGSIGCSLSSKDPARPFCSPSHGDSALWPLRILFPSSTRAPKSSKNLMRRHERVAIARQELGESQIKNQPAIARGGLFDGVFISEEHAKKLLGAVEALASGSGRHPGGLLLSGPPGCGKSSLAKALRDKSGLGFHSAGAAELKSSNVGGTAPLVAKAWEAARAKAPCIFFIDECEGIFGRRGSLKSDAFSDELAQAFLSHWDGIDSGAHAVMVLAATNRPELIDEALMSRFGARLELGLPGEEDLAKMLRKEFDACGLPLPAHIQELAKNCSGFSGRDAKMLATQAAAELGDGYASPSQTFDLAMAMAREHRKKASDIAEHVEWGQIALPEELEAEFKDLGLELKNRRQLLEAGIQCPRSALLSGPPGTGKTMLAKALASQSGLSFVVAATADLKQGYIGHSGQAAKALFERARAQSPCILFIDEIDILAPQRSGTSNSMDNEIIGQLLQELDGAKSHSGHVFLLAASNHPDSIDSALLSRFERRFELGLPGIEARRKICEGLLSGKSLEEEPSALALSIAEATEGLSGRDLRSAIESGARSAARAAMRGAGALPADFKIPSQAFFKALADRAPQS